MRIKPQVIAHRGGGGEAIENTRESIKYALNQNVSRYETDVRALKDGTIVLQHDERLLNPWGDTRRVNELSYQEYMSLRGPAAEHPISLKHALEDFPNLAYNVDIKESRALEGALKAVAETTAWHRVIFSSFSTNTLSTVRERYPQAQTAMTPLEVLKTVIASKSGFTGLVHFPAAFAQVPLQWRGITIVNRRFISLAHSRGIRVEPWTINEEEEMRQVAAMGVDAIMTDYPARLKAVLAEM